MLHHFHVGLEGNHPIDIFDYVEVDGLGRYYTQDVHTNYPENSYFVKFHYYDSANNRTNWNFQVSKSTVDQMPTNGTIDIQFYK